MDAEGEARMKAKPKTREIGDHPAFSANRSTENAQSIKPRHDIARVHAN
jgi:hypothetical protein